MIKELLSAVLLAVSLNSGISVAPKRAASYFSPFEGNYYANATFVAGHDGYWDIVVKTPMYNSPVNYRFLAENWGDTREIDRGGDWDNNNYGANSYKVECQCAADGTDFYVDFFWGCFNDEMGNDFSTWVSENFHQTSSTGGAYLDEGNTEEDYFYQSIGFNSTGTYSFSLGIVSHSVSFALNNCTTPTASPVAVQQGQTFSAKFTASDGYAFNVGNPSASFSYPSGALNPTYQVSDYVGGDPNYCLSVTITSIVSADCTLSVSPALLPVPTYNVTKTFTNCHDSGNTDYRVPDSFTASTLSNPYTIYVVANDGYFFKRDGSSYSFSSGVVVINVDYGANPQGQNVVWTEIMIITFSMPADDVSMTFTAQPITLADANALYNQGYQDARAIYENANQFAWLKNIWTGMAGFFAIEILPNVSLGFLCFSPLLVVAIIAIVRILKHD